MGGQPPPGHIHFLSFRHAVRFAANEIVASVGSKGDSYNKALSESSNGLNKWEPVYPNVRWNGLEDAARRNQWL